MPSAYDLQRLTVTHSPTDKLDFATGKLPDLDLSVFTDGIIQLIKELTGIDMSSPEAFIASIIELVTTGGPALELAAALLDMIGTLIGMPNLGDFLLNLSGALDGIDITNPGAIPAAIAAMIAAGIGTLITNLLNGGQGVNGINIFGSLFPGVISLIGAGHVGNTQPNLLANPGFTGSISLSGAGVWTHDAATGHDANGSAKTIADGIGSKDLLSNAIPVAQGQKLNLGCWVKWLSVTSIGTPIRLGVTTYLNNTVVSAPDVANLAASGTQATWQNLTGTYTVPAGVDALRVRLTVLPAATAGSFWFDDISAKNASNRISTSLIADANGNGLPDILDGLDTALGGVLSSLATKIGLTQWTELLTGLSGGSGILADIFDRLDDFLHSGSTLNGSNIGTGSIGSGFVPGLISAFDSLVNRFLGISGTGWGAADADHAIAANAATLLGLSNQVAQLQTVFTSGVTGGDEFERTESNLGADWDMDYGSGGGGWKTNGHDAYWDKSGTAARKSIGRYIPLTAQNDLMYTTATFASAPEDPVFPPGSPAINRVATRMSADNQNYVYADFGNGQVKIGRVVSGVETVLATGSLPANIGSSTQGTIVAGKPGTARYFKALLNGGFALDVTEASAISMVGSSYRQGGFGGEAGGWLLALKQSVPGRLKSIVVGDQ